MRGDLDSHDTVLDAEREEARTEAAAHRDDHVEPEGRCPNWRNHHRIAWCRPCESFFGGGR